MAQIDQVTAQRISDCARAVSIARARVEQARSFDERRMLEADLERAQREMDDAAMLVNRGVSRAAPAA